MTDRESLKMAAKAIGRFAWSVGEGGARLDTDDPVALYELWNPLDDDGTAMRLAASLGFSIDIDIDAWKVEVRKNGEHLWRVRWTTEGGEFRATREAITCAAAEIGKAMP